MKLLVKKPSRFKNTLNWALMVVLSVNAVLMIFISAAIVFDR